MLVGTMFLLSLTFRVHCSARGLYMCCWTCLKCPKLAIVPREFIRQHRPKALFQLAGGGILQPIEAKKGLERQSRPIPSLRWVLTLRLRLPPDSVRPPTRFRCLQLDFRLPFRWRSAVLCWAHFHPDRPGTNFWSENR